MTKKDYELIANVFKTFVNHDLSKRNANDAILELMHKLESKLAQDNSRFDYDRWDKYISGKSMHGFK